MEVTWPTFVETEQHRNLRDSIRAALGSWRRFIVAVDGVDAAGKSNLARYLAWQLGMSVIETDLFLDGRNGVVNYRLDHLKAVARAGTSRDRPVIIEGICVLRVLQEIALTHDYLVWVQQADQEGSHFLSQYLASYRRDFTPEQKADFVFTRDPEDGMSAV